MYFYDFSSESESLPKQRGVALVGILSVVLYYTLYYTIEFFESGRSECPFPYYHSVSNHVNEYMMRQLGCCLLVDFDRGVLVQYITSKELTYYHRTTALIPPGF